MSHAVGAVAAPQPKVASSGTYSALFDALPPSAELCVLVFDTRLRVVSASSGCAALFGREVVSASATELFHDFEAPEADVATLDLLTRSKGRPKHVRVYWKRGARRSTAFIVDLEAMSRGEHAVAAATARLVSKVVHEGRNPLTSIKLALQTIARSQLEDRLAKRLVIALREMRTSERIFSALAGLVRVSKPTEGADLAEALELAASDVRSELDERGLELQCDISLGEVPRRADAERVRVAVSQLIGILGHGLDKGVVRLAARQVSDGVEVSVEAEPVPSRRPSGMSLSLELAQKIAAEHGGRLVGSAQGFRLIIAA